MRIAETGEVNALPHTPEQEEHGFTRCRAERRLRREMPAEVKTSHRAQRGGGGS
jgi:hypothetical protein